MTMPGVAPPPRRDVLDEVYGAEGQQQPTASAPSTAPSPVLDDVYGPEPMVAKPIRVTAPPPPPMVAKPIRVTTAAPRPRFPEYPEPPRYDRFGEPQNDAARAEQSERAAVEFAKTPGYLSPPYRTFRTAALGEALGAGETALAGISLIPQALRTTFSDLSREEARNPLTLAGATRYGPKAVEAVRRAAEQPEQPVGASPQAEFLRGLNPLPMVEGALTGDPKSVGGLLTLLAGARTGSEAARRGAAAEPRPAAAPSIDAVAGELRDLQFVKDRTPAQEARLAELRAQMKAAAPPEPPPPVEQSAAGPGVQEAQAARAGERILEAERRKESVPVAVERRAPEIARAAARAQKLAPYEELINSVRDADPASRATAVAGIRARLDGDVMERKLTFEERGILGQHLEAAVRDAEAASAAPEPRQTEPTPVERAPEAGRPEIVVPGAAEAEAALREQGFMGTGPETISPEELAKTKVIGGERITAATYTAQSGKVYEGQTHEQAVRAAVQAGEPEVQGFPDVPMDELNDRAGTYLENGFGFRTSSRRLVGREEAGNIAERAEQLTREAEKARAMEHGAGRAHGLDATDVESLRAAEAGAPRDQAAVQEGLFGEKTLQGSEQTSLLPETAGVPTAKLKDTKIGAEEIGRVRREGTEPAGERPGELLPAEPKPGVLESVKADDGTEFTLSYRGPEIDPTTGKELGGRGYAVTFRERSGAENGRRGIATEAEARQVMRGFVERHAKPAAEPETAWPFEQIGQRKVGGTLTAEGADEIIWRGKAGQFQGVEIRTRPRKTNELSMFTVSSGERLRRPHGATGEFLDVEVLRGNLSAVEKQKLAAMVEASDASGRKALVRTKGQPVRSGTSSAGGGPETVTPEQQAPPTKKGKVSKVSSTEKLLARHAELSAQIARDEQIMGAGTYESTFKDENAHIGQPGQKFTRLKRKGPAYSAAGRLAQARTRLADLEQVMSPEELAEARRRATEIMANTAEETSRKLGGPTEEELATKAEREGMELYSPAKSKDAPVIRDGDPVTPEALYQPANRPGRFGAKVRRIVGGGAPPADVPVLLDIGRRLSEALGVPLRQGRFDAAIRKAEGVFKPHEEVARVVRFDKLDTVSHEIGHYVSKKYLKNPTMKGDRFRGAGRKPVLLPKGAAQELTKMGRDLYGKRRPAGGYGEEGIAEWHKFYVTDPKALAAKAPTFTHFMDTVIFPQEPALKLALDQAREDFTRYQASPANQRIGAMLSVNERVRFKPTVRWLMKTWLDDVHEFRRAVDELGQAPSPTQDAGVLARLSRGAAGVAEEMLERGVVKYGTMERAAGSIEEALQSVKPERLQAFREYLVAESALDRHARGIDPGISHADATAVAEAGRAEFQQAGQAVWDHYRALIEYRRDAGMLTEAQAKRITEANPHHVAFYREFKEGEEPPYTGPRTGRGYARTGSGVARQHGSSRPITDVLESVFTDTYSTVQQVKKYEVARELVRMARRTEGGGRVVEEVPAPKRPVTIPVGRVLDQLSDMGLVKEAVDAKTGERFTVPLGGAGGAELEGLLTYFEDARRAGPAEGKDLVVPLLEGENIRWYQIKDRGLYDAMQGLGTPEINGLMRWLSVPVRTLRAGATLTLEFAVARNPARDAWTSAVYSRAGFRPPGFRLAEGMFHYLRADDVYQQWRLAGGDNATMLGLDRVKSQHTLAKLMRTRTIGGKAIELVRHPLDTLRLISAAIESGTRLGEFAAVERKELREGAAPTQAGATAALASRDITVDFAQGGTASKGINNIVWTFNASLRGTAQLLRELRLRPGTVIPRALALVTLPSLALYMMQKDDPEYQDLPAWLRNTAWVWIERGNDRSDGWDGYGTGKVVHRWVLPKPFELGVLFGTVPERIAEWIDKKRPSSLRHMAEALQQAFAPPIVPTAIAPLIENYANRSIIRGRPIVPRGKENLPAGEQAAPATGETARVIGRALGYSPAKIENLVRGYTGGLGATALQGTDAALRGFTGAPGPVERPGDVLSNIPLIRAFVRRNVAEDAESIEELYRSFEEAEGHRLVWQRLMNDGKGAEAAAYLKDHRDAITRVATAEETGGTPGPLRVAYEYLQQLQQIKRKVDAVGAPERRQQITDAMRRLARKAGP